MSNTGNKLFIFGAGFSGIAIAEQAHCRSFDVYGTTRSEQKVASLSQYGIHAVLFDGQHVSPELTAYLSDTTHLLVSIAPGDADPVLSAIPDLKRAIPDLQWIGYLSTVGVYGNHDGSWVDEETDPRPVSKRSIQRLDAEDSWQKFAEDNQIPLAILRLSGIYGPGRNAFINMEACKARRLVKPGQVFNRVHRDDIGLAVNLAMVKYASGIFNITDDEPAPPQDVVTLAHEIAGREPPPEINFQSAELSPMARSFYGENKRVSNAKSKSELAMSYQWPNYRVALQRMWDGGSWE